MTRYEDMPEILQRLRLGSGEDAARDDCSADLPQLHAATFTSQTSQTVERLRQLLRDAEALHESLDARGVGALSGSEREEASVLLGKLLHELWRCEAVLQGVAPYD